MKRVPIKREILDEFNLSEKDIETLTENISEDVFGYVINPFTDTGVITISNYKYLEKKYDLILDCDYPEGMYCGHVRINMYLLDTDNEDDAAILHNIAEDIRNYMDHCILDPCIYDTEMDALYTVVCDEILKQYPDTDRTIILEWLHENSTEDDAWLSYDERELNAYIETL